ncbi:MAG: PQQ-like beta-propeller repeat protein [Flavobacteriales bacterium]|nr:PQQ-like beta-propeller repeat protein [Flavobacteriales bacterium]
MSTEVIDISSFEQDSSFYGNIPLILTIKNFDLAAIRKRYLNSKNNASGRAGSVERREAGDGGVACLMIADGTIQNCEVLVRLKEPRGVDAKDGMLAFSSEATVYILKEGMVETIEDDWFSYIHTVNFSPWDEDKILVSSSGFDCIFEFDMKSKTRSFEWFSWEHGFSEGLDSKTGQPFQLTRSKEDADRYEREGVAHVLIENPVGVSLPTANRAAFINSVFYDENDASKILATFFHEGKVYSIDRSTGRATERIGKLSKPHGGRNYKDKFLVTSTGSGEVVIGQNSAVKRFNLANLAGKPEGLGDMEWVQNTVGIDDLLVAIDSNRTAFVVIDPVRKLYDMVAYDDSWAVQDAVVGTLNEEKKELLRNL